MSSGIHGIAPIFIALALLVSTIFSTVNSFAEGGPADDEPTMDVVFVIDISGSTGGILSAVRDKFWEIQNEVARLQPTPKYRIGIVCAGRPSFKKENNYVKVISDLTTDIDAAAHPFFSIKDVRSPGNYFIGHALDAAVNEISWSEHPNSIRMMIFIGNGKPSAGPGFRKPIKDAKEKGITLHSLYFLTYSNQQEQAEWKSMAEETGGRFFTISLNEPRIVFTKSYDGELLQEANFMINNTYTPYGNEGFKRFEMQSELDTDAEISGEEKVEARSFFKATPLYQGKNASWDLIDYMNNGGDIMKVSMNKVDDTLAAMSDDDFKMRLNEINYERSEYISIIKMLSTQREAFLADKREKMQNYRYENTFFGVVNKLIRETAESHGFASP